jgi:hypothetical protein
MTPWKNRDFLVYGQIKKEFPINGKEVIDG